MGLLFSLFILQYMMYHTIIIECYIIIFCINTLIGW